jgi:hypothetical protein
VTTARQSKEAFRQAAKLLAGLRCLDAAETASGVILKLSASQMARDGLEAAAARFAESAGQGLGGRALSMAANEDARHSPYRLWWTCRASMSAPVVLSPDETWVSARDLRENAADPMGERELVTA